MDMDGVVGQVVFGQLLLQLVRRFCNAAAVELKRHHEIVRVPAVFDSYSRIHPGKAGNCSVMACRVSMPFMFPSW